MNHTINTQLGHRTIREFTDEAISSDTLAELKSVAIRTATSRGLQQASVIRVTDAQIRAELAQIGQQPYVARAPEYWLFIVDVHRNIQILQERKEPIDGASTMDVFVEAFTDACLMAQNVVNAVESFGLGANLLGNVLNDPMAVVNALDLPLYTFPVVGLTFGVPNQSPQLKPRMSSDFRFMENGYEHRESWIEALADYDLELQTYYDLRDASRHVDSFTDQVSRALSGVRMKRAQILNDIAAQGFRTAIA
ncbi:nitroreductase family protein [Arcanobacterium bovis]|uniref:NADPH-dependent oxidoreductase n=1 Tax=Arcanobacterium bovis TaxID=2529275 RepID=A0A4Q9V032_9ACTO|nr:nitroreductase family protein [Arcanobacterium bovis]TBW21978.1 NADPH-dependent oxidoreductase [Arcanobacterium bovis]